MTGDRATAIRNDRAVDIPADELQMGDLVLIQTGDIIPADLKLLEALDLWVDEFELTGEIMPVPKHVGPEANVLVFQGSHVLRGCGKGVVTAAGEKTEYGKILKYSSRETKIEKIPFLKRGYFALLSLLIIALLISLKLYHNHHLIYWTYGLLAFLLLPLHNSEVYKWILRRYQKKKLFRRNIFLQHERVLDEISNIDVFCFDKTGVLTSRDIKVKGVFLGGENWPSDSTVFRESEAWNLIMTGCALCHDLAYYNRIAHANPLDRALISYAQENGVKIDAFFRSHKKIYQKPFNSEERYMAAGFNSSLSGKPIFFTKGDPEVILKMCSGYITHRGEIKTLDSSLLLAVQARTEAMTKDGSVVIALAYGGRESEHPPSRYTFLCLFQLENPLQKETKYVLQHLREKKIKNVILTGDRADTALKVGSETGIDSSGKFFLSGKNIEKMPLSEVARQSEYVSVFARLLPSQKGLVIRLLQRKGHRIAMVGDGPNDVIALKVSDVAISFNEQSFPVARRAAQILVNDLADIPHVMKAAGHNRHLAKFIGAFLAIFFLTVLLGSYLLLL